MHRVDLHLHSLNSEEGEMSVLDLMRLVEQSDIGLASIVDPNVIHTAKEVKAYKQHSKVKWIEAIEIHAMYKHHELSVIGYGIDPDYPWFQDLESIIQKAHQNTLSHRLKALNQVFNVNLDGKYFNTCAKHRILTPQRLATLVIQHAQEKQLDAFKQYRPNGALHSRHHMRFIQDYLSLGKAAYVEVELPSLQEVIEHIHQAGGVAILAHPGFSLLEDKAILTQMVHFGLDGIEAYSPYHTEFQNVFYVEFALMRRLIITCGSDFYGSHKPQFKLGLTHCPLDSDAMLKQFRLRGLSL
jgi:3',5'-nucleoside bisphosphate phosphatase